MELRFRHWLGALALAAAIHLGAVWLLYSPGPEPLKGTPGPMRVEIAGPSAAPAEAAPESPEAPTAEARPAQPESTADRTAERTPTEAVRPPEARPTREPPPEAARVARPTPQRARPAEPPTKEARARPKVPVRPQPPEEAPEEPPEEATQPPPEPEPAEETPTEEQPPAEEAPRDTQAAPPQPGGEPARAREAPPEPTGGQEAAAPRGMPDSEREAYGSKVRAWLQRHKEYPRRARIQYLEGRVVLRLTVAADGEVRSVAVAEGSGHRVLDRAAREMARKASPLPAPEGLESGTMELVVPITYRLD